MSSRNKPLRLSICIPVYQGSRYLKKALDSIVKQGFNYYEIVLCDDNPLNSRAEIKRTKDIIRSFHDKKIRYIKNRNNLGSSQTIKKITDAASGDVIFYLCQDDILATGVLAKIQKLFTDKRVGVVTRPYFWFEKDIRKPIRAVLPLDKNKDTTLSVFKGKREFFKILESLGQLSGLALRKEYLERSVDKECFTAHIYPFIGILRKYQCVFLKDYTVAVRTVTSQSRSNPSIYNISPTKSWLTMLETVFFEKKYEKIRQWGREQVTENYEGLVQLKNFAGRGILENEILILIKSRWQNLLSLKFWFYTLLTLATPRKLLLFLTDNYKRLILSRSLTNIKFAT